MKYSSLQDYIFKRLENELPAHLTYHNPDHTKSVVIQCERIAGLMGIDSYDIVLLKTAALFHDLGFIKSHVNHEDISCEMANEILPQFDYNGVEIKRISDMINATRLPQSPKDKLSEILCDADLYYLGTDQYSEISTKLYKEYNKNGIVLNKKNWPDIQINFLNSHQFFTTIVKNECDDKKQKNLDNIILNKDSMTSEKERDIFGWLRDYFQIVVGVILAGIGLKGFLVPNQFFDGGNTGISLLIRQLLGMDLSVILFCVNLPFIIVGYYIIGRKFAERTLISILLLGVFILFVPIPDMTHDKLLIAIFGGAFLGIGTGLVMRSGAALDGIEVLALYTLKKTSFTMSEIIMGINIIIFIVAGIVYGPEIALYSVLTYVAATKCIDYIVEGLHAYTGVTIISSKSEQIKSEIVNRLGRAITVYKGERGFLPGQFHISAEVDIIFTVINRLELRRLNNVVKSVDPHAFMYSNTIKEISGGIIKLRHGH